MKRILALLMLVAMLLSFAACGSKKASAGGINFEVPEAGYDGSEVTITFYHTMGQNIRPVLQAYIPEFNKLYPNIHIVEESVGGYDDVRDQISTQISEGNQPNIAYCYADHVALYNLAGAVTTLDPLIDSEIEVTRADGTTEILGFTDAQKADFIQGYYNEGKQFGDGLMYTLPMSKSTEVLYYNATFCPTPGTSWKLSAARLRLLIPSPSLWATTPKLTGSSPCVNSTALPTPALPATTSCSITSRTVPS